MEKIIKGYKIWIEGTWCEVTKGGKYIYEGSINEDYTHEDVYQCVTAYIVFKLNGKVLMKYTAIDEFYGEREATLESLAYENNCKIEDIEVSKELGVLGMEDVVNDFVKGFETISKGEDMQELLNSAGALLDTVTDFTVDEQSIIYSNNDIKKHIGNLTSLALMLLVDEEIKYTDEIGVLLNIATLDFAKEFNEEQMEIANGLAYKYDKYFKGDIDFYPNNVEIQKLLGLESREVKKLKDCWGSESYFGFVNGKQYTEGYDTVKELVEQNKNFKFIQLWRYEQDDSKSNN